MYIKGKIQSVKNNKLSSIVEISIKDINDNIYNVIADKRMFNHFVESYVIPNKHITTKHFNETLEFEIDGLTLETIRI